MKQEMPTDDARTLTAEKFPSTSVDPPIYWSDLLSLPFGSDVHPSKISLGASGCLKEAHKEKMTTLCKNKQIKQRRH